MKISLRRLIGFPHIRKLCLGLTLFGVGCSAPASDTIPLSQLDTAVENTRAPDEDAGTLAKQSDLLHHFMVGQLALDTEDRARAYTNLEKANSIVAEPIIQSQVGQLLLTQGKLREAQSQFYKLVNTTDQKQRREALLLIGWIHIIKGDPDKALLLIEKNAGALMSPVTNPAVSETSSALGKQALSSEALLVKAAANFAKKDSAATSELFSTPTNSPVLQFLNARLQEERGNLQSSLEQFRELSGSALLSREALIGFARVLHKQGSLDIANSIASLQVTEEAKPFQDELVKRIARNDQAILEDVFAEPESIQSAKKLLSLAAQDNFRSQNIDLAFNELYVGLVADNSDQNRYQLALLLSQAGRMQEAADLVQKISPKSDLYVRSRVFAGVTLRQINKLPKSEKVLKEGISNTADTETLETVLLMVLRQEHKYKEAEKLYQSILLRDPNNERVLFGYGVLLQDMNDQEGALAVMDKILQFNPNNPEALNYVAYALAEVNRDLPRAEKLIGQAVSLQPKNGYFVDTQAWVFFHQGRQSDALAKIREAAQLEANDPEILEHYGDILSKTGNRVEAVKIYDQAKDAARLSSESDAKERADRIGKKMKDLK